MLIISLVKPAQVEIIDTPGLGRLAATRVVEEMKIQSQNDKDKLLEAKEKVYKQGFYDGVSCILAEPAAVYALYAERNAYQFIQ